MWNNPEAALEISLRGYMSKKIYNGTSQMPQLPLAFPQFGDPKAIYKFIE
jgi:hypothetical protein